MNEIIPFNKPFLTGREQVYIQETCVAGKISGNGRFTELCQNKLAHIVGCKKAFLTHSCTSALEMAAILLNIEPGDEVICPSFTFVSTINAFVLRGATPVFVEIRKDTLNLDEEKIVAAITPKTKAIIVVHYAGISCEMHKIMAIAQQYNLFVVEDAAHAIFSSYHKKSLGSLGHLSVLSFHETKNITCGEGGALLINDERFIPRAEIIWEKGTDRSQYFRGLVDQYSWIDIGSSFMASEMTAAFLWAQLEEAETIINRRKNSWNGYQSELSGFKNLWDVQLPHVPEYCVHNGHLFYLIFSNKISRDSFIQQLQQHHIQSVFHYTPLHQSAAGKKYGRFVENLTWTTHVSECLVRLPLWVGIEPYMDRILKVLKNIISNNEKIKER